MRSVEGGSRLRNIFDENQAGEAEVPIHREVRTDRQPQVPSDAA